MPCFLIFKMSCSSLTRACSHRSLQNPTKHAYTIDRAGIPDAYIHSLAFAQDFLDSISPFPRPKGVDSHGAFPIIGRVGPEVELYLRAFGSSLPGVTLACFLFMSCRFDMLGVAAGPENLIFLLLVISRAFRTSFVVSRTHRRL